MDELKVVTGFLAGVVVGMAIGTLIAPEEGKKLREKILDEADKLAGNLLGEAGVGSGKQVSKTNPSEKEA